MGRRSTSGPVDPAVQAARITRRGTVITALATVIAALIGGLFAAYKVGTDQGVATAPTRTVTVTATKPPDAPTGGAPESGVSSQVRLDAGTGVDLDAADPRAEKASGPNGEIDIYFVDPGMMVTRSAMYDYRGGEKQASAGCPKAVAEDQPTAGANFGLSTGKEFCVRTSEGRVGWVECNDLHSSGDHTGYVVLNYRLFATT
ncbi:hypothetical protein [Amycolatopsis sp. CA-126428]|uniref:hypothetical protein n=1 Tax=Amycolatopsis sp. CA-126428 TaxID=2073158 RepID=UPI000CCFDCDC|nr:hypothetical protein [Amycolatopsis sp. CA-126428]